MSIFHKNSGKGYNICKKFQIGSIILMTQMTNQKKTELIDFFDLPLKNWKFCQPLLFCCLAAATVLKATSQQIKQENSLLSWSC